MSVFKILKFLSRQTEKIGLNAYSSLPILSTASSTLYAYSLYESASICRFPTVLVAQYSIVDGHGVAYNVSYNLETIKSICKYQFLWKPVPKFFNYIIGEFSYFSDFEFVFRIFLGVCQLGTKHIEYFLNLKNFEKNVLGV